MKHAAIGFSSVVFPLTLLLAGVVAAQSVPPRKDMPTIAKAANDQGETPAKISDAFAKAEVLALQAIEIEKADSTPVTRPDGYVCNSIRSLFGCCQIRGCKLTGEIDQFPCRKNL